MTSKMDALEPEKRTDEAASEIFRSVLGQRAGYARGLGEMVIPDSRRVHDRIRDKEYAELVERHKKDAQTHKDELEAVREDMRKMMERQRESEKKMMEKQRQTEKLLMSLMSERQLCSEMQQRQPWTQIARQPWAESQRQPYFEKQRQPASESEEPASSDSISPTPWSTQ